MDYDKSISREDSKPRSITGSAKQFSRKRKNIEVIRWINQNYHTGCIYAAWGTNIEKRGYLVDECQHIVDSMDPDIPWFMNIPDEFHQLSGNMEITF